MNGFIDLQVKLDERFYTSVQTFKEDMIDVFKDGRSVEAELDMNNVAHSTLTAEQKDTKKLVKRILRGLQPLFEDALRKESELACRPYEQLPDLETLLNQSLQPKASAEESVRQTTETDQPVAEQDDEMLLDGEPEAAAAAKPEEMQLAPTPDDNASDPHRTAHDEAADEEAIAAQLGQDSMHASNNGEPRIDGMDLDQVHGNGQPLTPPRSEKSHDALANGGVPWYLSAFEIHGTTVYDEQYSGRDILRDMSEELSELDDDVLDGLADSDPVVPPDSDAVEVKKAATARKRQKRARNW